MPRTKERVRWEQSGGRGVPAGPGQGRGRVAAMQPDRGDCQGCAAAEDTCGEGPLTS